MYLSTYLHKICILLHHLTNLGYAIITIFLPPVVLVSWSAMDTEDGDWSEVGEEGVTRTRCVLQPSRVML